MSKPISPDEVGEYAQKAFPDFVFDTVNTLLATTSGRSKTLYQNKIVEMMISKAAEKGIILDKREIYDKRYLDFEDAYRSAGWKVEYDKPAYNESYEAHFEFSRK